MHVTIETLGDIDISVPCSTFLGTSPPSLGVNTNAGVLWWFYYYYYYHHTSYLTLPYGEDVLPPSAEPSSFIHHTCSTQNKKENKEVLSVALPYLSSGSAAIWAT